MSIYARLFDNGWLLLTDEAYEMAKQDEFSALFLDTEQRTKFLKLCRQARGGRAPDQSMRSELAAIIDRHHARV